jgi:glycosyltransferase involved in cell wall biosynthesis
MVIAHYYPRALVGDGGVSTSVRGWVRALAQQGHDVRVFADASNGGKHQAPHASTVTHIGAGRSRVPLRLDKNLHGVDVLVMHSGWVGCNIVAASAARRLGIPYVLTPHGAYDPRVRARSRRRKAVWELLWEKNLLECAGAVHVFFEKEIRDVDAIGGQARYICAPTGISQPSDPCWRGDGDYVLWIGRFDLEHKGIDLLLRALSALSIGTRPRLVLRGPDWRGGRRAAIQMVHDLNLDSVVTIGGPVHGCEKRTLLAGARLFVYPSRWEAQGLSMLEAVAEGVPLLTTTAAPAGLELQAAGGAAAVEPNGVALGAALADLLQRDLRSMSAEGRRFVLSKFDWDGLARSYTEQLQRALGQEGR